MGSLTFSAAGVVLPPTSDPAYASMEELLYHALGAAHAYMVWMCEMLQLPDPQIDRPPDAAVLPDRAQAYLDYLLERWRAPLADWATIGWRRRSILRNGKPSTASTRCSSTR